MIRTPFGYTAVQGIMPSRQAHFFVFAFTFIARSRIDHGPAV
jgi:hypothetical protein